MKLISTFLIFVFGLTTLQNSILKEDTFNPKEIDKTNVYWLTNAGFYINSVDGGILIDGILNADDEVANAEGIFSNVKFIFVSHVHGDHFNAKGLIKHLTINKEAQVILTPESFKALKKVGLNKALVSRIKVFYPEKDELKTIGLKDFTAHVLQFNHSGVQNIGLGLKSKTLNILYINGGVFSQKPINELKAIYPKSDIVVANKWPLVNEEYVNSLYENFQPKWLFMAHHSGGNDGIITSNGGLKTIEKLMTKDNMKGKIFTKRMQQIAF